MNSATFDEYGRMTANLGFEGAHPTPGTQNIVLYPLHQPAGPQRATPFITRDTIDPLELAAGSLQVTTIASAADGTQIWKITHNGVDTHPIHFHLFNVQLLNRVAWDNRVLQPDANELGWKDTVRMSPLEDTIVALRPIVPKIPFGVPDSHPSAQSGDAARRHLGFTTRTRTGTDSPRRSPTNSPTSVGSMSGTATSSATKRWT